MYLYFVFKRISEISLEKENTFGRYIVEILFAC